ncbi:MAG: alpha/beta hydrolase [Planctomycetota bacterium]|nr:alpha/beta hydrolase [Planctomycetota bacterium]
MPSAKAVRCRKTWLPVLRLLLPFAICAAAGCEGSARLPVTPNVLRDGSGLRMLSQAPADARKADMEVLYVTDRAQSGQTEQGPTYGYGRSIGAAFGRATVSLDPTPSWDELVRAASTDGRDQRYLLTLRSVQEIGQFPIATEYMEIHDGQLRLRPDAAETINKARSRLMELLTTHLANTDHKDVYIYVHGVNNSFTDSLYRAAATWHYLGRQGVFIAYAWPAGRGGLFGYFYDRESGEFTVVHLKAVLRMLAQCPAVERVHLVAHSRGTDVSMTALRELKFEYDAKEVSARKALKLDTVVLAAPDMDAEVFGQRLLLENLASVSRRMLVYYSHKDKAVGFADWLFSSRLRLGTLAMAGIRPAGQKLFAELGTVQLIQCDVSGFSTTHDYIFNHPAALSDLILVLRDGKDPGEGNGRPLKHLGGAFWELDNDYALPTAETKSR